MPPKSPVTAATRKALLTVESRLKSAKLSMPQRLDLLRKQAQLGDERDAALDRARVDAQDR